MDKTDVNGIYKESEGILLNKDNTALQQYKANRAQNSKLNNLEREVSGLKNDISEIKELLKKVLN